ncbi:hypothetical protein N836_33300 [Leptolyngbya sp. Heron Island J]|nr:hypothetical protein N836_33300 [Leptolyngbya sp. Heron Island J]
MAIISEDTFNDLSRYVSLRLQQGVPLVDADWNEMEDIRRFELRAFLKWFVGDGIPDGLEDSFRIIATGADNNFNISVGGGNEGLNAGRYLVDGLDVFITAGMFVSDIDTSFTNQQLHTSQPGAAQLAEILNVPVITPIPDPPENPDEIVILTVYLDVWERLVMPAEEPSLVLPSLGTESCARLRREWVIRVRPSSDVPSSGDSDYLPEHSYIALAEIRQDSTGLITPERLTDRRRLGLKVPSQLDITQLTNDAFGSSYGFNGRGQPALPISMREVINAILRGGRPAIIGPDELLAIEGPHSNPATSFDANGNQWLFWVRGVAANEIWFQRQIDGQTWLPAALLRNTNVTTGLSATGTSDGAIWIFWSDEDEAGTRADIFGQVFRNGVFGPEFTVSNSIAGQFNRSVSTQANNSNQVMVVWQNSSTSTFQSRLYNGEPAVATGVIDVSSDFAVAPALVISADNQFHIHGLDSNGLPASILRATWQADITTWNVPTPTGVSITAGPLELAAADDPFGGTWLLYTNGEVSITGSYLRPNNPPDPPLVLAETSAAPLNLTSTQDSEGNLQATFVTIVGPGLTTTLQRLRLISSI